MSDKVKIITPRGLLYWIHIVFPGTLNYDEDGYEYCASLMLHKNSEESKSLLAQIISVYNAGHGASTIPKRSEPYSTCDINGKADKKDTPPAECGDYQLFRFHTKPEFPNGSKKVIGTFNAAGDRIDMGAKLIGNGSGGAIAGVLEYYKSKKDDGVSMFLDGVQIIDYIEYTGTDPVFGKHEGFAGSTAVDAVDEAPKFDDHLNPPPEDPAADYSNMPEFNL